jgi:hypothetical protein
VNVTLLRRSALLLTLMFWQGGFMFYGAVVVPVGARVLGSHRKQGFITRSVTHHLNTAGAVALAVWCCDIAAGRKRGSAGRLGWLGWLGWALLLALLGVLAWLHVRLDELLDGSTFRILDPPRYHRLHQWYLIVSTAQWALAVALAVWTLRAWRAEDAADAVAGTGDYPASTS